MKEYTGAQGLPFHFWLFSAFAFTPNIVTTGMWANFLCLLFESFVIYRLALKLTPLTSTEALSIAALTQAIPLFNAAQDFPVIALLAFRLLFFVATLIAALAMERSGIRHFVLRGAALVLFAVSCVTNGALLFYYGGAYLLLYFYFTRLSPGSLVAAFRRFAIRYPDYLLLPPVAFGLRVAFIPQYGWYANYNKPSTDVWNIGESFWSFFQYVVPYHLKALAKVPLDHPLMVVGVVVGLILWGKFAAATPEADRSPVSNSRFFAFGGLLMFFAILPLAMIEKHFIATPIGAESRHCVLTALPLAILLFAVLRVAVFTGGRTVSRWLAPIVCTLVLWLGGQLWSFYVHERAEWIFSRSLLRNASKNEVVRGSSIILIQGYSVVEQFVYGLYAFAAAFGDMSRFPICWPPGNGRFYSAAEIQQRLRFTTILPSEFATIDPAGQQIFLLAERHNEGVADWDIACRYLGLHLFGTPAELDSYLASLCTLTTSVAKATTPFVPGTPREDLLPNPSQAGVPRGDFRNGVGLQMVPLPGGIWASKYETTQAQYEAVMGHNPSFFRDPVRPVECVSWNQADRFCTLLTGQERAAGRLPGGFVYRLPTTQEFDMLAVGSSLASAYISELENRWHSAPVGSLSANPLGLHDVMGNVWEWCLNWWDQDHRFKQSRGGSWASSAPELERYPGRITAWYQIAYFDHLYGPIRRDYPNQGFWDRGFRCVLAPPVSEIESSHKGQSK
jgi:formylglycine-generating enzyme required for sulfatase activity